MNPELITIDSSSDKYNIVLGYQIFHKLCNFINFSQYNSTAVLIEENIYKIYHELIKSSIGDKIHFIIIESGENHKNIHTAEYIWNQMIQLKMNRKSLLINFGGGKTSDLGGFVASTYMRGIDYINIPTTLLSIIDASIGGKTAINIGNMKNIVGCFAAPKMVFVDIDFLSSLNDREFFSGFAEIIKHSIIADRDYFDSLCNNPISRSLDMMLIDTIKKSLLVKKYIVETDYLERNLRQTLNFGHTVGHAFETLSMSSNNPLLHGEAIAIGIIIESRIALAIDMLKQQDVVLIEELVKKFNLVQELSSDLYNSSDLISIMMLDKKNTDDKINFALPTAIGRCSYNIKLDINIIQHAINEYLSNDNKKV